MRKFIKAIIYIGVRERHSPTERQYIILCNSLSFAMACVPLLFALLVWLTDGTGRFSWPLFIQPLCFLLPVLVNALGFHEVSRILLSWLMPLLIIIYSIINKSNGIDLETSSYVGFRITMIAASIVPFLLFDNRQKLLMTTALIVPLITILGFDYIHAFFGVGYYQVGLNEVSYPLNNIRALIGIIITGSGSLILKRFIEKRERENKELVIQLSKANSEVASKLEEIVLRNEEIEEQHDRIRMQNELLEKHFHEILVSQQNLKESQRKLEKAREVIETQKQVLVNENKQLTADLMERNKELEQINMELIRYNDNLQQYSYMVSHNLKGPVASLQGLLSLVPIEKLDSELKLIYKNANTSVNLLNEVIKDMNTIIDTQRQLTKSKEKLYWHDSVSLNLNLFRDEIKNLNIRVTTDFVEAPFVSGIKTFIDSIFYNLISNAIKYRSPSRALNIQIKTTRENQYIVLGVTDNGLGIDLSNQKENLFKIYKRFHNHVEGKGLGLYMVKMQTELMQGSIDVESKPDSFTRFIIRLPIDESLHS